MDLNSTLLIIILAILSVNIVFVGVYIVLVLREVRTSISKLNSMLDTVDGVLSSVAAPLIGASAAITALTKGKNILGNIKKLTGKDDKEEP